MLDEGQDFDCKWYAVARRKAARWTARPGVAEAALQRKRGSAWRRAPPDSPAELRSEAVAGEKWGPIQRVVATDSSVVVHLPQLVWESAKCRVERHLGVHI